MDEPSGDLCGSGVPPNHKQTNAEASKVSEKTNKPKPFFLDERSPITDNDFNEWRETMIDWIYSVPEYKHELLKDPDTPWGQPKGAILDHMLTKIVLYGPNIKNLLQSLQFARQLDHIWEIVETKLLTYSGADTPLPEYHTCVMPPVHQISMEGGMNLKSYCTQQNPCIMKMGPNIILHYILHYKKKGVWNEQYPEPVEKDKDPRSSYPCSICTRTFRNNPKKNVYSARGMLIFHLAKDHGQIINVMKNDKDQDMTDVINLLGKFLSNVEIENTAFNSKTETQKSPEQSKRTVGINFEKFKKTTKNIESVPYNHIYNYNKKTEALELKPVKVFHTCIMAQQVSNYLMRVHKIAAADNKFEDCTIDNPKKIEVDEQKWNVIQHYTDHYKKQGAWNELFPVRTEKQKEAYLKYFATGGGSQSIDSMYEGYTCKKCKDVGGKDKTWYFKAWSVDEKELAKDGILSHLTKCHHLLRHTMKKDTCLDMSSVLNILEHTIPSGLEDTKKEDWVDLWNNNDAMLKNMTCNTTGHAGATSTKQSAKRKQVFDLSDRGDGATGRSAKCRQRLCGDVFGEQEIISFPPNFTQSVIKNASNITNPSLVNNENIGTSSEARSNKHVVTERNCQSLPDFKFGDEKNMVFNIKAEPMLVKTDMDVVDKDWPVTYSTDKVMPADIDSVANLKTDPLTVKSENVEIDEKYVVTGLNDQASYKETGGTGQELVQLIKTEIVENEIDLSDCKQHSAFSNEDVMMFKNEETDDIKLEAPEPHPTVEEFKFESDENN